MDKEQLHEKFNRLLKQVATYTVTPEEIKQFLELVLNVIKNSKDSFDKLSAENLQTIKDNIAYIEGLNTTKDINSLHTKSNAMVGQMEGKISELKALIAKVKLLKPKDGEDGHNPSPEEVVPLVLAELPEPFVLKRLEVIKEINLGKKSDLKIELSQIESFDKIHTKLSDDLINRAIGIVDQRTSFLINKVSNLKAQVDTLEASEGNWGQIGGILSNQTDLQTALNGKANSLGLDDNYVTDAQLVVIGNTSGSNSGDSAVNSLYSGFAASKADVAQTMYIGTTQVAINRASAALALTGITSIDGSAATVTGAAQTAITSLGTLTALQVDNLNLNGNIISSTNTNGNITLTPNGTGYTILNGNVGIGTTAPTAKLEVHSTTYDAFTAFSNGAFTSKGAVGGFADANGAAYYFGSNSYLNSAGSWSFFNDAKPTWLLSQDARTTVDRFTIGRAPANVGGSPTIANFVTILNSGNVGIGTTSPSAYLNIKAGTASASTAPFKLTSGTLNTTAETGAMEYNGTNLSFVPTGTLRENVFTGARGSVTLTAGTTTTVTVTQAKTTSTIIISPTSVGATALTPYVSTKSNGSFVITTLTAAGTETLDYIIVN